MRISPHTRLSRRCFAKSDLRGALIASVLLCAAHAVAAEPIVTHGRDRIDVSFDLPEPAVAVAAGADGNAYASVELPGFGSMVPPGTPALPTIDAMIATPRVSPLPRVIAGEVTWTELALDAPVRPAQPPVLKRPGALAAREFRRDPAAYRGSGYRNALAERAGTWYRLTPVRKSRVDYLHLELFLAGFDPQASRLRVPRRLAVTLSWADGPAAPRPAARPRAGPIAIVSLSLDDPADLVTLARRGFGMARREGNEVIIYATSEELDELATSGFAYRVLRNDAPEKARALAFKQDGGLGTYHRYEGVTAFVQDLAARYPDLCRVTSIGRSVQGRELWAVKVSDQAGADEDEPEVRIAGALHGDEPPGMELCLYAMDHLLSRYALDARVKAIVDGFEIWFVPLCNPDGLAAGARYNADGIDLNRAFPDRIEDPVNSTAGRPPEVGALMRFAQEHAFVLACNFHAGARLVNYPFDGNGTGDPIDTPAPDDALFRAIATAYAARNPGMANSTQFPGGITNGAAWYVIYGGLQDWSYVWPGTNEVTIELWNETWPAESALPRIWDDNRESILAYLEAALTGASGVVRDARTGAIVPDAQVAVGGIDHATVVDPRTGRYRRMLVPGTYTLTFWAPGRDPVTVPDVAVEAGRTAALDVLLEAGGDDVATRVLIVAHESLGAGAGALEEHYRRGGFTADPLLFAGSPAPDEIRSLIEARYQTAPFAYLLLVGDTNTLPPFQREEHVSDLLYSLLDPGEGWEHFAGRDVVMGRLPLRSAAEILTYRSKLETFLRERRDRRFAWIAHGNDGEECGIAEGSHAFVRASVVPADSSHATFPCDQGTAEAFVGAVNAGVDVVTYSGHGAGDGWMRWNFDAGRLAELANGEDSPVVFSHACETGRFELERCFGEAWLATDARAALFAGASDSTYWDEDDILERTEFAELFGAERATVGEALLRGIEEVARRSVEGAYYHEIYHVFGDPTLDLSGGLGIRSIEWADGGNGIAEAGERGDLELAIVNNGGDAVHGMQATLASGGAEVQVLAAQAALGDLGRGESAVASFALSIGASCPAGHEAPLTLNLTFVEGSLDRALSLTVHRVSIVAGTVVLDGSGAPVSGAIVEAVGPERRVTATGGDGAFSFALIEGEYTVSARFDGFFTESAAVTVPPDPVALRLALGWASLSAAPGAVDIACIAGETCSPAVEARNPGTRPLAYRVAYGTAGCGGGNGACDLPYRLLDASMPGGPAVAWVGLEDATMVAETADDEVFGPFSLPFAFPFFGESHREFYLSANGVLAFARPTMELYENYPMPSHDGPKLAIAALWDDLVAPGGGGILLRDESERTTIEFRDVVHYDGSPPFSFQLILSADGSIVVQYRNVPWGALSPTVGIQGAADAEGLSAGPDSVATGAILFWNRPAWLEVEPESGEIPPGGKQALVLRIAPGAGDETLEATVLLRTNSPRSGATVEIPVTVRVETGGWHFLRGDANADGKVNIADPIACLGYLFGGQAVPCLAALEANHDGTVDIADAIYTLTYLFSSGKPFDPPFPWCGVGADEGTGLTCEVEPCKPGR